MFDKTSLTQLPAFKCGHAHDEKAGTGCTVVLAPSGAVAGVSVAGGAPATRETDLLRPENMIETIHAIVLSGGSAFGLEASCGVMEALAKRTIGFPMAETHVPIVVSACLFDLLVGENSYPDKAMGIRATETAFNDEPLVEGNVGAGIGASVGKLLGPDRAMKTGFGISVLAKNELIVAALVAVNAVGNIINPEGGWLAGCRDENNTIVDSLEAFQYALSSKSAKEPPANTTIGIVLSNAILTKAEATKVAQVVNDAYARSIKPVHTSQDGDTVFTMVSNEVCAFPDLVALMATEAMEEAIYRAVRIPEGAYGLPSARDLG